MELDRNLTAIFAQLCSSLSRDDVHFMDYLLRVNLDHRWPRLKPLTAIAVLEKMKELGMWKVDIQHRECHLSCVIHLLDEIGRRDLSTAVHDYGSLPLYFAYLLIYY